MRFEFPQGAIDGVACSARRQTFLKRGAIDALFNPGAHRFDRCDHGLRVIAQVVHARGFAAAAMLAILKRDDHHVQFLEYKTRDSKRRRQA